MRMGGAVPADGTFRASGPQRVAVTETLRVPAELASVLLDILPDTARRKFRKGQSLYRQGELSDQVFVVVSGRIGITMLRSDGHELLIDIVSTGALCGEGAAFDGQPRFSSANALETAETLCIPAADLCSLMASHPGLAAMVVHNIALKQRVLAQRFSQITCPTPEGQITQLLAQIAGPGTPPIMLTHQQIADLLGVSRITVTRAMQRLRREGAVRCQRGRYELVDMLKS